MDQYVVFKQSTYNVESGDAYSWGLNEQGVLAQGVDHDEMEVLMPQKIDLPCQVKKIATGFGYAICMMRMLFDSTYNRFRKWKCLDCGTQYQGRVRFRKL
jgi:hypothetical protein